MPKELKIISISEDELQDLISDYCGICLTCEEFADNVEPDARNYTCECCDNNTVFGIEEAFIMGNIEIV